jgi:hypothetical protein
MFGDIPQAFLKVSAKNDAASPLHWWKNNPPLLCATYPTEGGLMTQICRPVALGSPAPALRCGVLLGPMP